MKKIRLTILMAATLAVVLNFNSCKYEDGPSFTFRSKKARLTDEWEIVKIGTTNLTYDVVWEFEKDGDWSQTYSYSGAGSYTYEGDWEWKSSKEDLSISQNGQGSSNRFQILRLTNKELWLEDSFADKWELEAK